MEKLDPDQIYDPNHGSQAPKVKQLFRITKEHRYDLKCHKMHRMPLLALPGSTTKKCLTEVG